jgi:nucleoside 2-deoxyribosyltransferase
MIITICSSIDFTPEILKIKESLEKKGHIVNIPYFTQKIADGEMSYEEFLKIKAEAGDILLRELESVDMIKRYWNFIKNSDAILVLNLTKKGIDNYIGGSTLMEMGFAYGHDKKIFLYNQIPERSERIHYVDEIIDMKPIVLGGNLEFIDK